LLARGEAGCLVVLTCGPQGSGALKAAGHAPAWVLPLFRADLPVGQWNVIELNFQGDRVAVAMNGTQVVPPTPRSGLPSQGPVGLQIISGQAEFKDVLWRPAENGR
jgi:hypothetical protein